MATTTDIPQTTQMIVTLEDNAMVSEIKKALKLIRGIASVRVARVSDEPTITPAMRSSIRRARRESARGETIVCNTPEEMQRYFDSL
ncbi:MAG: hypothetical protein IJK43_05465 [Prevotella sp.]|nr:hypothetical protein [Prevotella sp.]